MLALDDAVYYLDLLISRIKGECRGCNEPCKYAVNGHGHPAECSCCSSYTEEYEEDED